MSIQFVFLKEIFQICGIYRFAHYLVHASLDSLLFVEILGMASDTNNKGLVASFYFHFFSQESPDLFGAFNTVHDRHIEICENYFITYIVFVGLNNFLILVLPIYAYVNSLIYFYPNQIQNHLHGFKAEAFIVCYQNSVFSQYI